MHTALNLWILTYLMTKSLICYKTLSTIFDLIPRFCFLSHILLLFIHLPIFGRYHLLFIFIIIFQKDKEIKLGKKEWSRIHRKKHCLKNSPRFRIVVHGFLVDCVGDK